MAGVDQKSLEIVAEWLYAAVCLVLHSRHYGMQAPASKTTGNDSQAQSLFKLTFDDLPHIRKALLALWSRDSHKTGTQRFALRHDRPTQLELEFKCRRATSQCSVNGNDPIQQIGRDENPSSSTPIHHRTTAHSSDSPSVLDVGEYSRDAEGVFLEFEGWTFNFIPAKTDWEPKMQPPATSSNLSSTELTTYKLSFALRSFLVMTRQLPIFEIIRSRSQMFKGKDMLQDVSRSTLVPQFRVTCSLYSVPSSRITLPNIDSNGVSNSSPTAVSARSFLEVDPQRHNSVVLLDLHLYAGRLVVSVRTSKDTAYRLNALKSTYTAKSGCDNSECNVGEQGSATAGAEATCRTARLQPINSRGCQNIGSTCRRQIVDCATAAEDATAGPIVLSAKNDVDGMLDCSSLPTGPEQRTAYGTQVTECCNRTLQLPSESQRFTPSICRRDRVVNIKELHCEMDLAQALEIYPDAQTPHRKITPFHDGSGNTVGGGGGLSVSVGSQQEEPPSHHSSASPAAAQYSPILRPATSAAADVASVPLPYYSRWRPPSPEEKRLPDASTKLRSPAHIRKWSQTSSSDDVPAESMPGIFSGLHIPSSSAGSMPEVGVPAITTALGDHDLRTTQRKECEDDASEVTLGWLLFEFDCLASKINDELKKDLILGR
eukprot:Lankesteria_metandrocarpae@DN252_c0_g1_i1.p1